MNLFVHEAAEQDLLRQVEWYAGRGLPDIARRFHAAVLDAIDALLAMPEGAQADQQSAPDRASVTACQRLRRVPRLLSGASELITVVRILHSKRDTGTILARQEVEEP